MRWKKILPVLIIAGIGIIGIKALFHPGFYTSHDGWHNIARLYHFHEALADGQIPPRWIGNLAHNYGYPLFVFSYHAPWWIAELLLKLGSGVIDSVKIVLGLSFVLSGIFMFLWVKDMWGVRAGLVSGIIFMWTPYRFAKILVGASVGEATAFLFLPLFFWSFFRLSRSPSLVWVGVGMVGLAGTILSHLMLIPLLAFFFVAYTIFLLIYSTDKKRFFAYATLTILAGFGLANYYLLPVVFYQPTIKAANIGGGFADLYANHLLNFSQLIYSKWGFGPVVSKATESELSFQVGIAQWLAVLFSTTMLVFSFLRRGATNIDKQPTSHFERNFALICLAGFGSAVLLMTVWSAPLWKWTSRFITLDYPWRLLSLTTITGTLLCGWCVKTYKHWGPILGIILIVTALYTNRNHIRVNEYSDIPLSLYIASETTTNTFAEYLPKWAEVDLSRENVPPFFPDENVELLEAKRNTFEIKLKTRSKQKADLHLNYLFFPGQTVYVNGSKADFTYPQGLISLPLPAGENQINVVYEPTSWMRLGDIISFVTLVLFFFSLLYTRKNRLVKIFFTTSPAGRSRPRSAPGVFRT